MGFVQSQVTRETKQKRQKKKKETNKHKQNYNSYSPIQKYAAWEGSKQWRDNGAGQEVQKVPLTFPTANL